VVIPREVADRMIEHARQGFPNEACGMLAADSGRIAEFYPVANAEASPVRYVMEPRDQLRAMTAIDDHGWEVGAIYHSHTRTRAFPSSTDIAQTEHVRPFFGDVIYVIVSLADEPPDIRAFWIRDGDVSEEPVEVD
jgi:proteasome lid subunit RPN8/RPN11